jgi:hypothetical protein
MNARQTLLVFTLTVASATHAQEAKFLDQLVSGTCAGFSAQLLERAEFRALITQRPIEAASVCSCAKGRMNSDRRLIALGSRENSEVVARLQNEEALRSYVVGRAAHSVMACFSAELDASLAASKEPN